MALSTKSLTITILPLVVVVVVVIGGVVVVGIFEV